MSSNETTPESVRKQVIDLIAYGWVAADAPERAANMVDKLRSGHLNEAIEAARSERLHDNTGTPEDEAYNQAISDVVAAIERLRDAKPEVRAFRWSDDRQDR